MIRNLKADILCPCHFKNVGFILFVFLFLTTMSLSRSSANPNSRTSSLWALYVYLGVILGYGSDTLDISA